MGDWDDYFRKALTRYYEADKKRREGRKSEDKRKSLREKEETIYGLYGRQCVICGGSTARDVSHINEDPSDDNVANLIPLCCNANQAIARADFNSQPDSPDEVDPVNIRGRAREHFRLGQYPQAYACNSLLAYLHESRRQDWTSAVESLVFSIAALRPLGHRELLVDTLAHCVYLFKTAGREVYPFWKAEVLSQMGLVLYDFRAPRQSLACELKAIKLYRRTISDHPEARKERKARGLKRGVLVLGPFLATERETPAFDIIKESQQVAQVTHEGQAYLSASWVEATLRSYLGQTTQSLDVVKKSLNLKVKADKYTLVGLHIQAARDYQRVGDKEDAITHYEAANALCEQYKIIPIPLPSNGALIVLDPGQELRLLGRNDAKLITGRKSNPFTTAILRELFRVIDGE